MTENVTRGSLTRWVLLPIMLICASRSSPNPYWQVIYLVRQSKAMYGAWLGASRILAQRQVLLCRGQILPRWARVYTTMFRGGPGHLCKEIPRESLKLLHSVEQEVFVTVISTVCSIFFWRTFLSHPFPSWWKQLQAPTSQCVRPWSIVLPTLIPPSDRWHGEGLQSQLLRMVKDPCPPNRRSHPWQKKKSQEIPYSTTISLWLEESASPPRGVGKGSNC